MSADPYTAIQEQPEVVETRDPLGGPRARDNPEKTDNSAPTRKKGTGLWAGPEKTGHRQLPTGQEPVQGPRTGATTGMGFARFHFLAMEARAALPECTMGVPPHMGASFRTGEGA